jgi:hypothetical protein
MFSCKDTATLPPCRKGCRSGSRGTRHSDVPKWHRKHKQVWELTKYEALSNYAIAMLANLNPSITCTSSVIKFLIELYVRLRDLRQLAAMNDTSVSPPQKVASPPWWITIKTNVILEHLANMSHHLEDFAVIQRIFRYKIPSLRTNLTLGFKI